MIKRKVLSLVLGLAMAGGFTVATSTTAGADAGVAGYTYICNRTGIYGDYTISFSKLHTCSNGPMDYTSISRVSNYSGKQVDWVGGECVWWAWNRKKMRSMSSIWSWCLTNPRINLAG